MAAGAFNFMSLKVKIHLDSSEPSDLVDIRYKGGEQRIHSAADETFPRQLYLGT
jgi:hypothetical protein